jgi:putative transposase
LNVNGEYSPAADGGQNGSPRESPTPNEVVRETRRVSRDDETAEPSRTTNGEAVSE